ncbi:MAG: class I SAM-dependent methyltransferase [Pseudomonadota bacterium]
MNKKPLGPAERLARKNAFDGSLVMGVKKFHQATGRDRHQQTRWDQLLDPATGLLRRDLAQTRPCPICGGGFDRPLFIKEGFPHGRCDGCGLIFVNPVLRDERVLEHYRSESSWVQVLESATQVELDRLKYTYGLDLAGPYLAGNSLLDVGAGTGLFLKTAQALDFDPLGVELHRENAARLRREGFTVIDRPLEEAGLAPGRFDLVSLWEVLEHIVHPDRLLEEIRRILKPEGVLLILVPNVDALSARVLHEKSGAFGGHSHVNCFNGPTLARLLSRTGFEVLEMETIITELGAINNHLGFEDPYLGEAPAVMDFITPELIHDRLLGGKLLALAKKNPPANLEKENIK